MKARTVRVMQAVAGSRLVALSVVAGTVLFLGALAWGVKKTCAWAVSGVLCAAMIGWSMDTKTALSQEADGSLVAGLRGERGGGDAAGSEGRAGGMAGHASGPAALHALRGRERLWSDGSAVLSGRQRG